MCLQQGRDEEGCPEQAMVSCNMVCMQAQGSAAGGVCGPPPHPALVMQQQSNQELCVHTALHAAAADLLCMVAGPFVGGLGPGTR
jgi:hypothetical protein